MQYNQSFLIGQAKAIQKNDLFIHDLLKLLKDFCFHESIYQKNCPHRFPLFPQDMLHTSKTFNFLSDFNLSQQISLEMVQLRSDRHYYLKQNHMRSKNMADYTDFTGKTNKKIVQPPGGASSFSIGWYSDAPERTIQRNNNWDKQSTSTTSHETKGSFDEPMRLMEEIHDLEFEGNVHQNFIQKDEANLRNGAYNRAPTQQNYGNNHRTCVKIHEQKSSVVLGDETYNYWEELRKQKGKQEKSSIRVQNNKPRLQSEIKTGVKVQQPPGGKSNFIFG